MFEQVNMCSRVTESRVLKTSKCRDWIFTVSIARETVDTISLSCSCDYFQS